MHEPLSAGFKTHDDAVTRDVPNIGLSSWFSERFELISYPRKSVLLDLIHGDYFSLNPTADRISRGLMQGKTLEEISRELTSETGIALGQANDDAQLFLTRMTTRVPLRPSNPNPIEFRDDAHGLKMTWQHREIFWVARDGRSFRLLGTPQEIESATKNPLEQCIRWLLPHLLMLNGRPVLHASAVSRAGQTIAIVGPSGIGKSTLARILATAGWERISDDLLLLDFSHNRVLVCPQTETDILEWSHAKSHKIKSMQKKDGSAPLSADLPTTRSTFRQRLSTIWQLNAERSEDRMISTQRLHPADSVLSFLDNSFAEIGTRKIWQACFRQAEYLAKTTKAFNVRVPNQIDKLKTAVTHFEI